jgi:molybdate transport system substrate-binding protein
MKRLPLLALGLLLAETAWAAEIKILCANPVHEGLVRIADQYKRETGHNVTIQAGGTPDLNRMLAANEPADILVGTSAMTDQAMKDGKAAGQKTAVGRVGIGIVVRRGARVPVFATPEALRQTVLAADSVIYNTAGSGQFVQRLFDQLGLTEQIKAKSVRPSTAGETMERLLQGKGNDIAFGLLSEVMPYEAKGVQVAGPLPAAMQNYTGYDAIVLAVSKAGETARDFIRYLTTANSRKIFAATGVD